MEVTIRLDRRDQQTYICSTWPEWSRKFERLYGSPKRVTERDGNEAPGEGRERGGDTSRVHRQEEGNAPASA
jgi:hypothetical protein